MTRLRLALALALALLALAVAAPTAANAAIKTRIIPAEMVFEHGAGDDPTNCSAIGFIRWKHEPKWVATRVLWRTTRRNEERSQPVRPPYDDAFRHTQKNYWVAPGYHWSAFSRSWADGAKPNDCSDMAERAKTFYHLDSARVEQMYDPDLVELSGRVTERTCVEGDCKVVPLPGVAITRAGVRATTGTDGRWSMEVRSGRWKVVPAAPGVVFEPPSRRVVVKKKAVRNLNFEACRLTGPAASTAVLAAQKGSSCDPDGIDWWMPRRLTPATPAAHFDRLGLPKKEFLDPSTWEMKLFVTQQGKPAPCEADVRWRWVLEPKDDVEEKPEPGCSTRAKVNRLGKYEATAIKQRRVDGDWKDEKVKLGPVEVTIDDIVIAGVGDSLASGEGNPAYYFKDCDRSTDSYQFRAALFVEQADPHTSVTFLHPACSGARLEHMWARNFRGTRGNTSLDPQLTQVAERLRAADRRKPKVHAAIASIGVNDIAFGPVLGFCTRYVVERPRKPQKPAPCPTQPVKAVEGDDGFVERFKRHKNGRPLEYEVDDLFAGLQPKYADFITRVRTGLEGDGLGLEDPARVLLTQYPNFSHNKDGVCDTRTRPRGVFRPRWSPQTWGWVGGSGDRLSKLIVDTSGLGYTAVPMDQGPFHDHGYCRFDGRSWFMGIFESRRRQRNVNGAFHPKAIAHGRIAADTRVKLCEALYGDPTCKGSFSG